MSYTLPRELEVNGKWYNIRADFRDIINVLIAFNDPELKDNEKVYVCLKVIYEDFEEMNDEDYEEAFKKASSFIDLGKNNPKSNKARTVDFEQDEQLIIPAVNRVAGREVLNDEFLHWWSFMGYFMEIGECAYSTVLGIRSKRAKGKKLEKWEQEFFNENKDICIIQEKLSEEEKEKKERLNAMLK